MLTLTTIKPSVVLTPVKSTGLHIYWPFLERGLNDIIRKTHPDWLPPDVYMALRAEAATAVIVSRGTRLLGFIVWHKQERVFSHILDIFVWAAWALPLRERLPGDDIEEAVWRGIEYLRELKLTLAAKRDIAISSRKGLCKKYGLKPLFTTYEVG